MRRPVTAGALAAALLGWAPTPALAQSREGPAAASARVPPTGVQTCLAFETRQDDWPTPQPCDGAGPLRLVPKQDGMLGAGVPSYEAVPGRPLTECVRDRVSGLVWEGKPDSGKLQAMAATAGPPGTGRLIDSYGPHHEPRPGSRANTDAYSYHGDARPGDAMAYVAQVNAQQLCGYTDWRLPTVAELHGIADVNTLMDSEASSRRLMAGRPAIDARWFPNTVPGHYLASEPADATSMWCVDFKTAYVYTCYRRMRQGTQPLFVRLVRGPEAPETARWREMPDERGVPGGAVQDRATGLVWRRCEEPQTWNGKRCTWSARRYTYMQAVQRAAGETGWRVPSVKEMNSLVGRWIDTLDIPPADFPATGAEPLRRGFWTSTVCSAHAQTATARAYISAWAVSDGGNLYCESRIMGLGLRLVRE